MEPTRLAINAVGAAIIKKSEGCSLTPYLCPADVPTIGWGSIWRLDGTRVQITDPAITQAEADLLFTREVNHVACDVLRLCKVPVNVNQLSALVSFTYNVGIGNFKSSTLRMKLNRGDYEGAANEFWKWRRANGVILRGLVLRRKLEENLFNTPVIEEIAA